MLILFSQLVKLKGLVRFLDIIEKCGGGIVDSVLWVYRHTGDDLLSAITQGTIGSFDLMINYFSVEYAKAQQLETKKDESAMPAFLGNISTDLFMSIYNTMKEANLLLNCYKPITRAAKMYEWITDVFIPIVSLVKVKRIIRPSKVPDIFKEPIVTRKRATSKKK